MTAMQKAKALVDGGLADDLDDAAGQLLDMGEASVTQADAIRSAAARDAHWDSERIAHGIA